ncbi:MAG: hypothetical protein JSW40_02090 [Candidatus Omnitrophota bacterium]|nr:MAG: hypothetical protein JSW40_02090 [Candidatus Omnitrophota bacterium]
MRNTITKVLLVVAFTLSVGVGSGYTGQGPIDHYIQPQIESIFMTQNFGFVSDSAIKDNYAYVVGMKGMVVLDITDPSNPKRIRTVLSDELFRDIFIQGNYAYITTGRIHSINGKLKIFDISNPKAVREIKNNLVFPENTVGLIVEDNLAYVGGYGAGFFIVDVSNPKKPFVLSKFAPSWDGKLTETQRKVRENIKERILSDPETALKKGKKLGLNTIDEMLDRVDSSKPGHAWWFDFKFPYAFVCFDSLGLHILDVSDPVNPRKVSSFNKKDPDGQPNYFNDVAVSGDYAYIALDHRGFLVLDISNIKNPREVAHLLPWGYVQWNRRPGSLVQVKVKGNLAFASAAKDGLYVYDISTPYKPVLVKKFGDASKQGKSAAWGVEISGDLVGVGYTLEKTDHPIKGAFEIFQIKQSVGSGFSETEKNMDSE